MLEKYGKFQAAFDTVVVLTLLVLAVKVGGFFLVGGLVLYSAWVLYSIYAASAAVEADRVAARYEQVRSNPPGTQYDFGGGGYTSQPAPQPTVIHNNSSSNGSDFVMGMALGSMMSGHSAAPAAAAAVTVHHVYDQAPDQTRHYDEPAALAPITSEQLDGVRDGHTSAPAPQSTYGETLAPITSEELDNSSSSSSSWSSPAPSSDSSSSSSSDWGSSSSSSSSSSDWGSSSSSYDSGSSSSGSWD
jgi:uncharacterized membrane protein YgcG